VFQTVQGVLKFDKEITSVLYIVVHSSRDRHCCLYIYNYTSGRDQVEVSKARSKSTTATNLCFRYSGERSSSNASLEKQYKTRVGEPKAHRPPDLEVARTPAHLLDVLVQNSISKNRLSHSRTESTKATSPVRWSRNDQVRVKHLNLDAQFPQPPPVQKHGELLVPWFVGAPLTAFAKNGGGVRPFAVGEMLICLTSKRGVSIVKDRAAMYFGQLDDPYVPVQLGVGVRGGAELAVHLVRSVVEAHGGDDSFALRTFDFTNAFNEVSRQKILDNVQEKYPELYPYVNLCYAKTSHLWWDGHRMMSAWGSSRGTR
jgi:hypothetical protein